MEGERGERGGEEGGSLKERVVQRVSIQRFGGVEGEGVGTIFW